MKNLKLIAAALLLTAFQNFSVAQSSQKVTLNFSLASKMPYHLLWPAVVNTGPYIFAINGYAANNGGYSSNILSFNTQRDEWRTINNNMGYKLQSAAVLVPSLNATYVFGGIKLGGRSIYQDVQKLDMASGKVSTLNIMNPAAAYNGLALNYEGDVYLLGGTSDNKHTLASVYKFDPNSLQFSKMADMPESCETTGAVVNGIIYTFGGYDQFLRRVSDKISAYDIKNNTWAVIGKMPEAVSANSVAVYGNMIFVIGGYDDEMFLGYYDTTNKTFTKLKSNLEGRRAGGAAVVGDKLYVFGGTSRFYREQGGNKSVQVADLSQFTKSYTSAY